MRRVLTSLALIVLAVALACQSPPASTGPQGASTPEPAVPEGARPLVELAKGDLSRRKGIPEQQIKVVSVEEVSWPNGALGYPKPGMAYIQVIITGYRITLTDGAKTYEYHTDTQDRIEHGED